MQKIAPSSLSHLPSRIAYVTSFLDFKSSDVAYLHAAAPIVKPLIPAVVDAVYVKLLSYDITAKAFVPRGTGFTGAMDEKHRTVIDLSADDEQIKFRKDFLKRYLARLVEMGYDNEKDWEYLDKVAVMHTGQVGFQHRAKKPGLRVELIHMSILLGYVEDILVDTVVKHPDLDDDTKAGVLRAFNKVLWIQNDLFSRHYVVDEDTGTVPVGYNALQVTQQSKILMDKVHVVTVFSIAAMGYLGWMVAKR
ncbi:Protoglobin-domain-containing protein [Kalaharituber pfeilii]|nr:Protoglobin-domain-containing protein [Kalaharituber pfeilii]